MLEFIELQKETHGSKTFTVNYAMTPLYVPHNFLSLDFCERIGMLLCIRDIWWDFANDSIAKVSFGNVAKAIDEKNGGDCYSKTEQTVTVLMAQN